MATVNVNLTGVEPSQGFSPLPKNFYRVMIDESSVEPTKNADGAFLKVRFVVIDGVYAKRTIFENFNIKNANVQTVNIALAQLAAICKAINYQPPANGFESSSLHNIPFIVKVKIDKDEYNRVTEYLSIAEFQLKHADEAAAMGLGQAAPSAFTPPPMANTAAPAFAPPAANSVPPMFAPPAGNIPPVVTQAVPPPVATPPAFAPPAVQAPAPMTPPAFAAPVAPAPEPNYWISHPSLNDGTPLLKSKSEIIGLTSTGLFDILVMTEDQTSGWKSAPDFDLVAIAQTAGAVPGMPTTPGPWNTAGK
jgi:hypothetical protein